MACQQLASQPWGAIAEQGLAPEDIAQQVGVEDQQRRRLRAGLIFPLQLATGDLGDVRQASLARIQFDEAPHVFIHPQATESLLEARRQPAFAGRLGTGQDNDLHVRSTGSARHSRQPCMANSVNRP